MVVSSLRCMGLHRTIRPNFVRMSCDRPGLTHIDSASLTPAPPPKSKLCQSF